MNKDMSPVTKKKCILMDPGSALKLPEPIFGHALLLHLGAVRRHDNGRKVCHVLGVDRACIYRAKRTNEPKQPLIISFY